jgi:hypothetical protein
MKENKNNTITGGISESIDLESVSKHKVIDNQNEKDMSQSSHTKIYVKKMTTSHIHWQSPAILLDSHNIGVYVKRLGEIIHTHPQIYLAAPINEENLQQIFAQLLGFKSWKLLNNLLKKQALRMPELSSEQSMTKLLELTVPQIIQKPEQLTRRETDKLQIKKSCTLFDALTSKTILKYPLRWHNVEVFPNELCSGDYFLPLILLKMAEKPGNHELKIFEHFSIYTCPRAFLGYSVDYNNRDLIDTEPFIRAFIKVILATREKTAHGYIYNLAVYGTEIEKVMELLRTLSEIATMDEEQKKTDC